MRTFSLNNDDTIRALKIWSVLKDNEGYFKKFNFERYSEAMTATFILAMSNYKDAYGDLTPYIKKLARTVLMVKETEVPYDVYNPDGEISSAFTCLKEFQDITKIDGVDEIERIFKDLYLIDTTSFMDLEKLYLYDNISDLKGLKIKNDAFKMQFSYLIRRYGAPLTFKVLSDFYQTLPELCRDKESKIKEIKLKEGNYTYLTKITDTPTIIDEKGRSWGINKSTLSMNVNPDYIKWDTVWSSVCDILKIDMTPLLDYVYAQIYVSEGVNTKHIEWCGDRYKLTTPGGTVLIHYDKDKYIKLVRTELILNLLQSNVNTIIALSEDSVYIKPTRTFRFDVIRLTLFDGKIIDLPISVHMRKRKQK